MRKLVYLLLLLTPTLLSAQEKSRHNQETAKQLEIFNNIYRNLELYYVDTLNAKKHLENATSYMLSQIDPYTEYYPKENTEELKQLTSGKYAGIGAVISVRKDLNRCIISHPYEGMPAANAGVRRGDIILSIDGKDTGELKDQSPSEYVSAVSKALRGQVGIPLQLKVRRPGVVKDITFTINRRPITMPSVTCSTLIADSIGYILLNEYKENTAREVRLAFVELKRKGATSLILDLRNNPGGLMDEAVKLVNLFIPRNKEVVSTRGKNRGHSTSYKTQETPIDLNIPIAILTSRNTASAAEITAGALQDYDRAVIIGQRTYGKGLVQETRALPYGGILKLTTSKYYIPSGRCIQAYKFEDGEPVHLPDSLTKEFHTAKGRPVRDGGGIAPDFIVPSDSIPNLLVYLQLSDQLFDYCVRYRNTHPVIAAPDTFQLTDAEYADFRKYLKEHNFTYDQQSKNFLKKLREVVKFEGYGETTEAEFAALEAKLVHNEDYDFKCWEKEIRQIIEAEIVSGYYYDYGAGIYALRNDKYIKAALKFLQDKELYLKTLNIPPK